jgi:hypothetical protein
LWTQACATRSGSPSGRRPLPTVTFRSCCNWERSTAPRYSSKPNRTGLDIDLGGQATCDNASTGRVASNSHRRGHWFDPSIVHTFSQVRGQAPSRRPGLLDHLLAICWPDSPLRQ